MLTAKKRESLFDVIIKKAMAFGIGSASVEEINEHNILQATFLAMQRAVEKLIVEPAKILVDGNRKPYFKYPTETIVEGDKKISAISAASILAKVTRDREMVELDKLYPGYGFAKHKGYGTEEHLVSLKKLGPSPIHRKYFMPVRQILGLDIESLDPTLLEGLDQEGHEEREQHEEQKHKQVRHEQHEQVEAG